MPLGTPEQVRRWFEYEKDSHAKVLAALQAVPTAKRTQEAYDRALGLLGHVVAARRMWLYRFGVAAEPPGEFFPRGLGLEDVTARVEAMQAEWSRYLERLGAAELDREFEYRSTDGQRFRSRVEDILTQLFGHSWYHRGQIAQCVRSLDEAPAVTDWVFWTRQALDGPATPQ